MSDLTLDELGWGGSVYAVRFVGNEALPPGHDWALVHDQEGNCYAFLKWSRITPRLLEEAWAGFRLLATRFRLVA